MTDPVGKYQYYLCHGNPPINDFLYIGKWKRGGGKWILSIDDDYFNIPKESTARLSEDQKDLFYGCFDLADVVLTSTQHLADQVKKPHKTYVAPNLMQVSDYEVTTVAETKPNEKLRILWAGSTTHCGDFVDCEPAINELLKKWKDKVEFIFMGYCPGNLIRDWLGKGVHYEQGCALSLYPKVLKQIRPHITLAPLDDNIFNKSKSNIRILESWSLASAVVASDIGEYKVVKHGQDGLLAYTTEDWFEHIDSLIANRDLRESLATAGRKRVEEEFDWDNPNCYPQWHSFISSLRHKSFNPY
jgi:glycosyltransferase involved in cell wall biosynthesis